MILNLITKAKELFFNNKASGLSATNVQGAIDEVKAGLDTTNSNFNYQMAEQKVGTWYNGKTIYRRIFAFTIDSANYNYETDLPISYVDEYWMGSESFKKYDTGRCSPLNIPHSNPVSANACFPSTGTTNIVISTRNGTSETTGHYLVVLYYTKA